MGGVLIPPRNQVSGLVVSLGLVALLLSTDRGKPTSQQYADPVSTLNVDRSVGKSKAGSLAWGRAIGTEAACETWTWPEKPAPSLLLRGPRRPVRMLQWLQPWTMKGFPGYRGATSLCEVSAPLRPWARRFAKRYGPRPAHLNRSSALLPCEWVLPQPTSTFSMKPGLGICNDVRLFGLNLSSTEFEALDVIYIPYAYSGVTPSRSHRSGNLSGPHLLPPRHAAHLWVLSNGWESASTWPVAFSRSFHRLFNYTQGPPR
jgi:hypothetical protein